MEVHAEPGVPLAVLLKRELHNQKVEKPDILFGEASKSKKGEDFTFLVPKCHRSPTEGDSIGGENASHHDAISVFAVMIHWLYSYCRLMSDSSTFVQEILILGTVVE
jgi:hypothetical protein